METSELTEEMKQVYKHLDFLGYDVEVGSETLVNASHESRPNVQVSETDSGLLLFGLYAESDKAKSDRKGYLEFINEMNNNNQLVCWGTNDNGLWSQGFYSGGYDREAFGTFLEAWSSEIENMEALASSGYAG